MYAIRSYYDPSVVYAWVDRIERKPWSIISGSREGGMYRSTNGGETISMNIALRNDGTSDVNGVGATLSTTDPYVIV